MYCQVGVPINQYVLLEHRARNNPLGIYPEVMGPNPTILAEL